MTPTTDALARRLAAGPPPAAGPGLAPEPEPGGVPAAALERLRRSAAADGLLDVAWTTTASPVGELLLAATPAGLVQIAFEDHDAALEHLAATISPRVLASPAALDAVRRQLDEYFAGRRHDFDLAIDRTGATPFHRSVLEALVRVPYGATVRYGDLASAVGRPGASRAVGTAMRTNPIPIVQPCHRVLPADGTLGRYAGGTDRKRALLTLEGVRPA